jgi:hypothetical protein
MFRVQHFCLSVFMGAVFPLYGFAQATKSGAPKEQDALSLSVSGGISLGSYMAGYLYYATEFVKNNPTRLAVKSVTGASAGSVNAFVSIVSLCSDLSNDPQSSLFWHSWKGLDIDRLMGANPEGLAVFSREPLIAAADSIEKVWKMGLPESCDMVLGVTTTRRRALEVKITDTFLLPRAEEKFLLRIQGRGRGKYPFISNYLLYDYDFSQSALFLGDKSENAGKQQYEAAKNLMFASSAFPVAFMPVKLSHCVNASADSPNECNGSNAQVDEFVDGGVFDNQPLRLAFRIASAGLRKNEQNIYQWIDKPSHKKSIPPTNLLYTYVDLSARAYPVASEKFSGNDSSLLGFIGESIAGFVGSSRSKEIYTLLEGSPEVKEKMRSTLNYYPRISEHLGAFFGFFDESFREFDYYLGIYDAYRSFRSGTQTSASLKAMPMAYPEERYINETNAKNWDGFLCMRAVFDRQNSLLSHCASAKLYNFRILMQVSLNRLYQNCSEQKATATLRHKRHADCSRAMAGESPPQVPGLPMQSHWRKKPGEGEFEHTMRLLAENYYHFKGYGLSPEQAALGKEVIKEKLVAMVDNFSEKQDTYEGALLKAAGRPLLNFISYSPSFSHYYLTVGSNFELGASISVVRSGLLPSWFRVNPALQIQGLHTLLSSTRDEVALSPVLGFELEPLWASTAFIQWRAGVRGGYRFSFLQNSKGNCSGASTVGSDGVPPCNYPVIQPHVSFSLLERMRFSAVFQTAAQKFEEGRRPLHLFLGMGLQI